MELQRSLEKIRSLGLGVAAISYDSPAVLRDFAQRRGISYPLLSDEKSATIRAFGILNEDVPQGTPFAGIPHPGTYIVDRGGRVVAKFFEDNYTERNTAAEILVKQFGGEAGSARSVLETRHLGLTSAASSDTVVPGQIVALTIDIALKPGMHVYAPGVQGYIPVQWSMSAPPGAVAHRVDFPASRNKHLPAIDETVPVYEGKLRLVRDVTVPRVPAGTLVLEGELKYQACDDKQCFIPQTVPLKWALKVEPLDVQRTRPELQRNLK